SELRRLVQRSDVEDVTCIHFAISAILSPVIRILIGLVRTGSITRLGSFSVVTDATRQRVVCCYGDALRRSLLERQKHSVIVLSASVHNHAQSSDFVSVLRSQ